jgi:hypothetical protein
MIPELSTVQKDGRTIETQINSSPLVSLEVWTTRRNPVRRIRDKYRVTRRIQGILVNLEGPEAHVIFDTKDGPIQYILPSKLLLDAGIKIQNQPFEYSEFQVTHADDTSEYFHEILAMAPASSATVESLPLSAELKAKRNRVLNYFAKRK